MKEYSWIILNGKNGKHVMIISAHIVCKEKMNIRLHMAHMQQVKHLLKRGMIAPNPRKEVMKDLNRLVE